MEGIIRRLVAMGRAAELLATTQQLHVGLLSERFSSLSFVAPGFFGFFNLAMLQLSPDEVTITRSSRCSSLILVADPQRPNQSPEPMVMSVTPRADARVAPATTMAHL
jgi:hypothetical protein